MNKDKEIKNLVNEKYSQIALNQVKADGDGCSCCCGGEVDYTIMSENYESLAGYFENADLGLGCGLPTEFAQFKPGHTVLDLGCGAGNDVFIARHHVKETGYVIGIDFSDEMLAKANKNKEALGLKNVDFRKGEIEDMPVEDASIDVVISNCVLNLVPNKKQAFKEIYRVLKNGGHFCISDIVLNGPLPEALQKDAELYAGCVAGAIQNDEYLGIIREVGFELPMVVVEKNIELPDDLLEKHLSGEELQNFKAKQNAITSVTVVAKK